MRYAETGFNLEVDLTRGNIERLRTDPELTALHLGGDGTAAEILWDRVPPEVEPFSPDNLLIFSAGLLDATPVPGANRTCISSISPQSNLYVHSGFEGFFGPEMKHAGYDKIVIRGKSPGLVYLWIHDDKVEIRDAGHLQGKSPHETAALIQQELKDPKVQVAAIGVAGENKVYQASIEHANSSASRGVGVIMGDKGLKAIAVRGTKDIQVARPAELFQICIPLYREIYDNPSCGDLFLNKGDDSWHVNHLPWSNARKREGYWLEDMEKEWEVRVESERITTQWENYSQELEEIRETVVDKSELLRGTGCYNCPKECHRSFYLPGDRKYFLKSYGKLAYAMAAYEDLKFNYDLLAAMQEYGLDESSMPQVLAFALELYEAGILTDEDLPEFPTDGEGRFLYLLEKVARREGVGDALANGLYLAARQIGRGAEAYDRTAKRIERLPLKREVPNYSYFLMYATGGTMDITQVEGSFPQMPIPDRKQREEFVRNWDAAPEKFKKWFLEWEPGQRLAVEAAAEIADWNGAMHDTDDALGICSLLSSFRGQFGGRPPYHLHNLPKLISLATGMDLDSDGLLRIARRNRQLVRAINVRRGLRRRDENPSEDLWPDRDYAMEQKYLDAYYEFQGWTSEGIPAEETLDELALDYVREDLVKRGILTDNEEVKK
jgi:aldehyde:ferredoxin oxidoreductase